MDSGKVKKIKFKNIFVFERIQEDKVIWEFSLEARDYIYSRIEADIKKQLYQKKYREKKGIATRAKVITPEDLNSLIITEDV